MTQDKRNRIGDYKSKFISQKQWEDFFDLNRGEILAEKEEWGKIKQKYEDIKYLDKIRGQCQYSLFCISFKVLEEYLKPNVDFEFIFSKHGKKESICNYKIKKEGFSKDIKDIRRVFSSCGFTKTRWNRKEKILSFIEKSFGTDLCFSVYAVDLLAEEEL